MIVAKNIAIGKPFCHKMEKIIARRWPLVYGTSMETESKTGQHMEFIKFTRGVFPALSLRDFAAFIREKHQNISNWADPTKSQKLRDFLKFMCKCRKASGASWSQWGKILDAEFLQEEEKKH